MVLKGSYQDTENTMNREKQSLVTTKPKSTPAASGTRRKYVKPSISAEESFERYVILSCALDEVGSGDCGPTTVNQS